MFQVYITSAHCSTKNKKTLNMFQFIGRGIQEWSPSHHARLRNICSKRPASQKQKDGSVNQVLGRTREAAHLSFLLSGGARGDTPCDVGDRAERELSSTTSPRGGGSCASLVGPTTRASSKRGSTRGSGVA